MTPITAIIAGTLILAGVIFCMWLDRLREIRKRNRTAFPGVDNAHFVSRGGEAAEAWRDSNKEFGEYTRTARKIVYLVKWGLLSLAWACIAIVFAIGALEAGDWPARAAMSGLAMLAGVGSWRFAHSARMQLISAARSGSRAPTAP